MNDLYDRIVSQREALPKLIERIPGFTGYLDLAARRAADRMMRDYVADLVKRHLDRLAQVGKRILDLEGGLALMSELESARLRWQSFHDRVRAAAPGYAGFFELIKVDAEAVERLYSFDEAQIRYADQLDDAIQSLETAVRSRSSVAAALQSVERLGLEANEAFSLREDVLTQIGEGKIG